MKKLLAVLLGSALIAGCSAPTSFTGTVNCDPQGANGVTVCRATPAASSAPATSAAPVQTPTPTPVMTTTPTPTATPTASATPTVSATPTPTDLATTAMPIGVPGSWKLAFEDNFNTLDRKVWTPYWFGDCVSGSTMNKVQTCSSNVSIQNGELLLQMSSASQGALVSTNPKDGASGHTGFQYTDGYAEARVFFPGTCDTRIYNWPAWWTTGQSWPGTGEIDIAEPLGGVMYTNYHSSAGNFNNKVAGCWAGAYHTYGVDRRAGTNDIYFDGVKVKSYATQDGNAPQYLVLNVGYSSGSQVMGAAGAVKVDYVRVWNR